MLDADVEIRSRDQLFNLLVGRALQKMPERRTGSHYNALTGGTRGHKENIQKLRSVHIF
jgi:hypothetical protein